MRPGGCHSCARSGVARPSLPAERGPRYERGRPNELWHIDIKGPFFIQLASGRRLKTWIVGLVDDHSRFVLGLRIHSDTVLAPILAWLRERIDLCGIPLELMSDNGTPFVYWIPGVLTRFGRTLEELHIRHVRTQVNSPWTNGKVERLWGILQAEVLDRQIFRALAEAEAALAEYVRYYNYHRLHGEIGWLTPARALRRHALPRPRLRERPRSRTSARVAGDAACRGLEESQKPCGTTPRTRVALPARLLPLLLIPAVALALRYDPLRRSTHVFRE